MTGGLPGGIAGLQVDPRLLMAQTMMSQGGSGAPVLSPLEGIARTLQGALGGYEGGQVRQQNIDALNQAMAALSGPSSGDQAADLLKASNTYRQGNPYGQDPFMPAAIAMKTRAPTALPVSSRLVNSAGQVLLDAGAQSKEGQQFTDALRFAKSLPDELGPVKTHIVDTLMATGSKGALVGEREGSGTVGPSGDVSVNSKFVRGLEQNKAGGAGAGKLETARPLAQAEAGGAGAGRLETAGAIAGAEANARLPAEQALQQSEPRVVAPDATLTSGRALGMPTGGGGSTRAPGPIAGSPPAGPAGASRGGASMPPVTPAPVAPVTAAPAPAAGAPPPAAGANAGMQQTQPGVFVNRGGGQLQAGQGLLETLTKNDGARLDGWQKDADLAATDAAQIAQIRGLADQVKGRGWGADTKLMASRVLTTLGATPEQLDQWNQMDPGKGQALNKLFVQLSSHAARQMGAREPGSVIAMFKDAYPGLETDPRALDLMSNTLAMDAQYRRDRATEATKWALGDVNGLKGGGDYKGLQAFQDQFNKTNDPKFYMHAATAMSGDPTAWKGYTNPDQARAVMALIPSGRAFAGPDGQLGWMKQ